MSNRLTQETSPYLKQHADNPVDWYPWGEEAFQQAHQQNKPIHLSIGYAACHWCHVMARESFENPEIAQLLNKNFVNIKVDRQERPDVDDIYQQVVQMMNQGGGWPLTIFMTPAGEPFFGGTYFPPKSQHGRPGFTQLISAISETWKTKRDDLNHNINQLLKGYKTVDAYFLGQDFSASEDIPAKAANFFAEKTDPDHGGIGSAPKFPNVSCYDLVLRVYHRTREPRLLKALEMTLDQMAAGGIYDHLGGGFARYCVDDRWIVPHFEKMLYDNGQLIKLYADAYRLTGKQEWRRVFEETIAYILRDMTHPEGGFYASEDADSEGEEGKFYVWTPSQIKEVLGKSDGTFVCYAYGVTEIGNFEQGTTILHRAVDLNSEEEMRLADLRDKLLKVREKRERPGRDEGIITSWNALMIQGLCAAYQATGTVAYLKAARCTADFIMQKMATKQGGIYHIWHDAVVKVPGFLDDYAFLANALLDLYESGFDSHYLDQAVQLVDLILKKFWDDGLYYTSSDAEKLVHRPRSPHDHALPSGTSSSLFALFRLYELTGKELYRQRGEVVWCQYGGAAAQNPFSFAHLLTAHDFMRQGPLEIVITGDRTKPGFTSLVEPAYRTYHPARVLAVAEDVPIGEGRTPVGNKPAVYICRNQTCEVPLFKAEEVHDRLKGKK